MQSSAIEAQPLAREEIVSRLETEYGIEGPEVYLLDVLPLIEMAWADGAPRPPERRLIYEFALRLLAMIDREASGMADLSTDHVNRFLERFLDREPSPGYLRRLRALALPLLFDPAEPEATVERRHEILRYCLDIGAAAVRSYPYDAHDRFSAAEKAMLLDLTDSLLPVDH